VIEISELVPRAGIGWLFPDARYYIGPDGLAAGEAFALIRDGIKRARLVALGRWSHGTRESIVAIEPGSQALRLSTLRYAAETRSEEDVFPKLVDIAAPAALEMPFDKLIAARSGGGFDPARFADRYAAAVAGLVRDKIAGKMVTPKPVKPPQLLELEKAVKRSVTMMRGSKVA
jgi:Ku protein